MMITPFVLTWATTPSPAIQTLSERVQLLLRDGERDWGQPLTEDKINERDGKRSYLGVTRVSQRVKVKMARNITFKGQVEEINDRTSKVKGRPQFFMTNLLPTCPVNYWTDRVEILEYGLPPHH